MTSLRSPSVVIASKIGRLGNRLFLSAYFMANALSKGYRIFNPALAEYARLFEGSCNDPFCEFPSSEKFFDSEFSDQCRGVFLTMVDGPGSFAAEIGIPGVKLLDIRDSHDSDDRIYDLCGDDYEEALHSGNLLLVKGWKFRDEGNLLRFHGEISRYFNPVLEIRLNAERALCAARKRGNHVIGVHIRQGDYRGWKSGQHYFETLQYAHWMRQAEAIFLDKKTVFLVCASDALDRGHLNGLNVVEGPGSVAADLHALSLCDSIIGPPSTFSSWASYIGRVPVCMMEHHKQNVIRESFVLHQGV